MTLILTLLLMLSLTMMASAIIIVVNNHADLTSSVTQKPIAMKTADSCVDQAIGWLLTSDGATWAASGVGATKDIAAAGGILYGKSLTDDTARSTDARTDKFKVRTNKSACTSVILTILAEESSEAGGGTGVGSEAGSESSYDADTSTSAATYIIKVVAEGIFNTPTLLGGTVIDKENWESGSSRGTVEVVLQYQT
tara:strand:- start:185 stop:772 length:588 start_codon:yes stop_codon:yes gene_type:complete